MKYLLAILTPIFAFLGFLFLFALVSPLIGFITPILGITFLIYMFFKEPKRNEKSVSKHEYTVVPESIFEKIRQELRQAYHYSYRAEVLERMYDYVNYLEKVEYKENKEILKGILQALVNYNELLQFTYKDEAIQDRILSLEEHLSDYEYALRQMYLESTKLNLDEIDININVLDQQLKYKGLSKADF